tara:strand:- start:81563 stop:81898 length:336 start_codon:yes stop_codon:yes gene_type:complete
VGQSKTALQEEGFGVLTEIDIQATLKAKIGEAFRPYIILGACNPKLALGALQREDKIGVMLPCNVIIQETGGSVEVAAIDPVTSIGSIGGEALLQTAEDVKQKLERVVAAV